MHFIYFILFCSFLIGRRYKNIVLKSGPVRQVDSGSSQSGSGTGPG